MQNLFAFIWRNSFYFLYLILIIVSLMLMSQNNYYQRTILINTTNGFTGGLLSLTSNFSDYLKLKSANKALAEENARLLSRAKYLYLNTGIENVPPPDSGVITGYYATGQNFPENSTLTDTSKLIRQFEFIAAKVISNSVNRRNNYLKLNKGSLQGVRPNMAVIAPNGLVGQVVEVSSNFSSVMSVLNRNSRVSSKHKSSNQVGSLLWDGTSYRMGKLVDIPSHVQIFPGDSIVSSGYSHVYPEGVLIGTVEEAKLESGASFYQVTVRFSADFNKLSYVYVVNNLMRSELMRLQESQSQTQ